MMRTKRNKRTSLIVILLLLILFISVGYAALSSELSITTNATIKKQNWDVHFENVQVKEGSVEATTAATIDEATRTNVTYAVAMNTPGDFYEFTVDVKNDGGIDAMVETIANTTLTDAQLKYLDYTVTYSDGAEIQKYDKLAVGAKETLKVNLTYKKDINVEDLPTADETITLTLSANYVQADSNAKDREKVNINEIQVKAYFNGENEKIITIRAEEGMTWGEWYNSPYCKESNEYLKNISTTVIEGININLRWALCNEYGDEKNEGDYVGIISNYYGTCEGCKIKTEKLINGDVVEMHLLGE